MADDTFMGVKREKIDWRPTIDYSLCNLCMECDKFCPHKVFEMRDGRLVVANPANCVVFCKICAKTCPFGALSFPSKPDTLAAIKRIREEKSEQ
jgi:NAD-dependent dihydropyrimidine dehydrogenase PreA subunit